MACFVAAGAGVVLLVAVHKMWLRVRSGLDPKAMTLFHLSNSYLAFIFLAVAVDTFARH